MKIERTRNASRNIIFGIILNLYQIIVPFLIRTLMIYFMGIEYLGLNSLFASILQVLNLVELGVGSAMIYSMYKPIVDDDTTTICALLKLYRTYYRIIGCIVAIIGTAILPFIPNLIKGSIPNGLNIYILYLLNLCATVLSYWLFAYKNSLLTAHQRNDLISKVTIGTNSLQYVLQLAVIIFLKNYYWYLIIALFTQAITNVVTAIVTSRKYPNYRPKGKLNDKTIKLINRRVKDLFTSKIGTIIVNSTDTIIISSFLGLTILAVYQNYYYILTSIIAIVSVIFSSCTAGIGNSIIVETAEKNFTDLKKFTFIISWLAGFCTCCLLCLYQPFMKIWVGEKYELAFNVVICLCIYYFVYEINQLLNTYKDAAGIWHEDRFRPLVTALINLVMNLLMVQYWGIYGVILSTVLSMLFVGMPWLLHNIFTVLFPKEYLSGYLKCLFIYVSVTLIGCSITYFICDFIHLAKWPDLFVKGIICCIVPNVNFFIAYNKRLEFKQSKQLIKEMTKGKLSKKQLVLK